MKIKAEDYKVVQIYPIKSGQSSNSEWRILTIVVEKEESNDWGEVRTSRIALTAMNKVVDKIMEQTLSEGDIIDFGFEIGSRQFKKQDGEMMENTNASLRIFTIKQSARGIQGGFNQQPQGGFRQAPPQVGYQSQTQQGRQQGYQQQQQNIPAQNNDDDLPPYM